MRYNAKSLYRNSPGLYKATVWFSRTLWMLMIGAVVASVSYAVDKKNQIHELRASSEARIGKLERDLDYSDSLLKLEQDYATGLEADFTDLKYSDDKQPIKIVRLERRRRQQAYFERLLSESENSGDTNERSLQALQDENDGLRRYVEYLKGEIERLERASERKAKSEAKREVAAPLPRDVSIESVFPELMRAPTDLTLQDKTIDALRRMDDARFLSWLKDNAWPMLENSAQRRALLLLMRGIAPGEVHSWISSEILKAEDDFLTNDLAPTLVLVLSDARGDAVADVMDRVASSSEISNTARVEAVWALGRLEDRRCLTQALALYGDLVPGSLDRRSLLLLPQATGRILDLECTYKLLRDESASTSELALARKSLEAFPREASKRLKNMRDEDMPAGRQEWIDALLKTLGQATNDEKKTAIAAE